MHSAHEKLYLVPANFQAFFYNKSEKVEVKATKKRRGS